MEAKALGIRAITTSIHHHQTNGKCERAHRTVRQWLTRRNHATIADLQAGIDEYRVANNGRQRVYLQGLTPQQRHELGHLDSPTRPRFTMPLIVTDKPSTDSGNITVNNHLVGLRRAWAGKTMTVFQQDNQITVFHGNQLVVDFVATTQRRVYQSANPPGTVSAKARAECVRDVLRHHTCGIVPRANPHTQRRVLAAYSRAHLHDALVRCRSHRGRPRRTQSGRARQIRTVAGFDHNGFPTVA